MSNSLLNTIAADRACARPSRSAPAVVHPLRRVAAWEQFSSFVGLVVGINQFTFAFGSSLVRIKE